MKSIFITDEGKNLLAAAASGGEPISFSRICTYDQGKKIAQSTPVAGITGGGNSRAVFAVTDNSQVREGYYIEGLGLFARSGDEEILFGYCEEDSDAFYMPAGSESSRTEVTLRIELTADCSDSVTLQPDSDAYASAVQLFEEVARLDESVEETRGLLTAQLNEETARLDESVEETRGLLEAQINEETARLDGRIDALNFDSAITQKVTEHDQDPEAHSAILEEIARLDGRIDALNFDSVITQKISEHDQNSAAHSAILAQNNVTDAKILELGDRLSTVETVLKSDITAYSATVSFGNLNGTEFNGIWNSVLKRIEF